MTSPQEFKPHGKGYLFDHLGMSFSFDPSGVATGFATLEAKTNFVATTDGGTIKAVATPKHLGRSTQMWDVEIISEKNQKTLAWFRCTQSILWPKPTT